jgi:hypothetical protein
MSGVWTTKYGRRRVRRDPPTIAAALMDVPPDHVMATAVRMAQRKDVKREVTFAGRAGSHRAVVIERKPSRRPLAARLSKS